MAKKKEDKATEKKTRRRPMGFIEKVAAMRPGDVLEAQWHVPYLFFGGLVSPDRVWHTYQSGNGTVYIECVAKKVTV